MSAFLRTEAEAMAAIARALGVSPSDLRRSIGRALASGMPLKDINAVLRAQAAKRGVAIEFVDGLGEATGGALGIDCLDGVWS